MEKRKRTPAVLSILGDGEDKEKEGTEGHDEMESCAHELMEAVKADDVKGIVSAFKAMFACCNEGPTEEG
jgi:hypothetical protein